MARNGVGKVDFIAAPRGECRQCEVLRSTAPRLAMCMHRQAGKSLVASILAVHQAVWTPGSLVLLLSPSQRQSA